MSPAARLVGDALSVIEFWLAATNVTVKVFDDCARFPALEVRFTETLQVVGNDAFRVIRLVPEL